MVSETDKYIKDVSSVASIADFLFPEKAEMPKLKNDKIFKIQKVRRD